MPGSLAAGDLRIMNTVAISGLTRAHRELQPVHANI
jgi:hypothetical protein